ncbi:hypothetical protein [Nonomuraea sp. SBT364]|uniref:hypothetical protein n=1 Tax=Nonomuraea sp. SBT364 TaxID=1580530 RepID=UPI00066A7DF4|nr:hypothetical protein [Nonomuraea sp. SBT364]
MRHVAMLVIGMILLVLGAQGGIRLLADRDDAGLLHWVPGGFAVWLTCYVVAAVAGALLAARARKNT